MDAAIVRIMKGRKQMKISDLRLEVITIMQIFKPDDNLIRNRLESLIQREFLERDSGDNDLLRYKA